MAPDIIAILSTGIALAILMIGLFTWLRADVQKVDERITRLDECVTRLEVEMRERMAKLEGLLEGLRAAITGKHAA